MSVKIRLQRRGRKKLPLYHIVIADSRAPRDGRFIENIGSYNPLTRPATIEIDRDKAFDWLMKGAEPTDTVRAILKFKGVMYRKHLNRGVAKGAMTQEEADAKYQAWIDDKEARIAKRVKATSDEISAYHSKRSGTAKAKPKKEEEPVAEAETAEAPASEEAQPVAEAPAKEGAESAETTEASPEEKSQPVAEATVEEGAKSAETTEASPEEKTEE